MSAPASVEALRRQLQAEQDAHAATMAQLQEQTRTFQAVLAEQQEAFTDLITRVTELRVAKGECMAAQVAGRTQHMTFNTGSALLDGFLYSLHAKLEDPEMSVATSVLQKLENAALEALTPYGPGRVSALLTSNASAVRTTGLLVLFPNDVRGVRQWARKHLSSCASCAARQAQLPAWTPYRYDSKGTGFAAAPNLRAIPNKNYHHVAISLLQERSIADRMDTENQLVIMRATALVRVQSAQTGQPLADSATTCAQMTSSLQAFLAETMTELRSNISVSAPWSTGANPNSELSAAIEILLHMVEPSVQVRPMQQVAVNSTGASCTLVEIEATVSVPLHVSALAPLLRLMDDPAQRGYVIQQVLTPLARRIGDALGDGDLAAHYTSTGLRFAEALYHIAVHQGLVETDGSPTGKSSTNPSSRSSPGGKDGKSKTLEQLYLILQALAVFGTSVDVEVITPHVPAGQPESKQDAKRAALRLARALLRQFAAPNPHVVPRGDDVDTVNMTIKVSRAPTTFLEVLNRAFSSNHRLPPTSRSTALDAFMSPKSKISLGLKLFRELVVEVYRPYHPCTGIVLAAENGVGGRPRAPPCVPVIDLPVDVVEANVRVAAYVEQRLQQLNEIEASDVVAAEGRLEREGKAFVQRVASTLQQAAPAERLCRQWTAAQITVNEVSKVRVDALVPFAMTEVDARSATKPLLYLHVVYSS
ncbi:hypothetical protein, conserved [Leishmania donovani]|uniref:Uncharacterized protein n=1 Tax=Leishmania donovani TaxID=5661 RepID=E9BDK9_LEIDO|nr:hypothetical protein, conserved [Leishmania donovani]TPP53299.1 hypothetical protein CGC21_3380 [Leishmania donovani]CBZ33335.1 hypothetical protein, conserved [Leishmania donovani]